MRFFVFWINFCNKNNNKVYKKYDSAHLYCKYLSLILNLPQLKTNKLLKSVPQKFEWYTFYIPFVCTISNYLAPLKCTTKIRVRILCLYFRFNFYFNLFTLYIDLCLKQKQCKFFIVSLKLNVKIWHFH